MNNLIICPVYNEEKYVGHVIDKIRSISDIPILIVNDGSTDNSLRVIKSKQPEHLLNHNKNMGYGKSLIDGINFAIENDFSSIVTIDGDMQHDPTLIPLFFNKIQRYEIVSGSRYLYNDAYPVINPPKSHYLYHRVITKIINETFNSKITDAFCGYKGYRLSALQKLELDIDEYGFALQVIVQMLHKKIKYVELSVPMIYHKPVRERISPEQKLNYYIEVLKSELIRVGYYKKEIFDLNENRRDIDE